MDDATRSLATAGGGDPRDADARPALVVVWSADEPGRVGELAWLDADGPLVLGRTGTLRWIRSRPGREEPAGDLQCPRISREQVVITPAAGGIELENVGRCPLLFNGRPATRCPWVPGALLELQDQLLL